jgi:integrase/recombinase XerD
VLAAGRVHVDLWAAGQLDTGAAASNVRRRLSALSSFYGYCAAHDLTPPIPTEGVKRPPVDPDYTATVGLDRDQARALVAAADADTGRQALRTAALVRLLMRNALRVDEACAADIADLGEDSGHRVLRVVRKGARKAKIPLTPATVAALDLYLTARADQAGVGSGGASPGRCWPPPPAGGCARAPVGPRPPTRPRRQHQRVGGVVPRSLRHSAITFALDAGATLREVQDYVGHKDSRTTRRYDHSRDSLDRNATYTVAAYLA